MSLFFSLSFSFLVILFSMMTMLGDQALEKVTAQYGVIFTLAAYFIATEESGYAHYYVAFSFGNLILIQLSQFLSKAPSKRKNKPFTNLHFTLIGACLLFSANFFVYFFFGVFEPTMVTAFCLVAIGSVALLAQKGLLSFMMAMHILTWGTVLLILTSLYPPLDVAKRLISALAVIEFILLMAIGRFFENIDLRSQR